MIGEDGAFAFTGLPAEHYSLSANVRGYRVSAKNASLDMLNQIRLLGTVYSNVTGLRLLYEPGRASLPGKLDWKSHEENQRRRNAQLRGAPEE